MISEKRLQNIVEQNKERIEQLVMLGILKVTEEDCQSYNVGESDYSKHLIQSWHIWMEYDLNPWDADIIKRVLRSKHTVPRRLDYEKIKHICKERIRQIDAGIYLTHANYKKEI